jgi:hypothetical protein
MISFVSRLEVGEFEGVEEMARSNASFVVSWDDSSLFVTPRFIKLCFGVVNECVTKAFTCQLEDGNRAWMMSPKSTIDNAIFGR